MTLEKLKTTIKSDTPLWYRRFKKITTLTTDTLIVILLGAGFTEHSLALLITRVGASYILNAVEIFVEPKE